MKERKEIHVPFLLAGGDVNWTPRDGVLLPPKLRLVSSHRSPRSTRTSATKESSPEDPVFDGTSIE